MTTPLMSLPLTRFGDSSQITAPLKIGSAPYPVSGAVILATPHIKSLISWCQDCCCSGWTHQVTDLGSVCLAQCDIPIYAFYFRSKVDLALFQGAFATEMRLALELQE